MSEPLATVPTCGALEDDDLYAPCLHPCERPEGHDGPHRFTYEWDDNRQRPIRLHDCGRFHRPSESCPDIGRGSDDV
jgi:hypothetical protein